MVTVGECNLVWWQGKVAAQAQGECEIYTNLVWWQGKVAQGAIGSTRSTWHWFVQVKAGLQGTRESKPPNIQQHIPLFL